MAVGAASGNDRNEASSGGLFRDSRAGEPGFLPFRAAVVRSGRVDVGSPVNWGNVSGKTIVIVSCVRAIVSNGIGRF